MPSWGCFPKREAPPHACSTSKVYPRRRRPTSSLRASARKAAELPDLHRSRAGQHAGAAGIRSGLPDGAERCTHRLVDGDEAHLAGREERGEAAAGIRALAAQHVHTLAELDPAPGHGAELADALRADRYVD